MMLMLPGRTRVVASGRLRAIYIVGLLLALTYFAHASVLPVNEAREPDLLSEMGRTVRLIMPSCRLSWWIGAWRLIRGIMVHPINRQALFNQDLYTADIIQGYPCGRIDARCESDKRDEAGQRWRAGGGRLRLAGATRGFRASGDQRIEDAGQRRTMLAILPGTMTRRATSSRG